MKAKPAKRTTTRSAKTGLYIKRGDAAANPDTSITETTLTPIYRGWMIVDPKGKVWDPWIYSTERAAWHEMCGQGLIDGLTATKAQLLAAEWRVQPVNVMPRAK